MKVSLPPALRHFVSSQVNAGEFDTENAVVTAAVRLLRDARERLAMSEMASAFAGIDSRAPKRAPTTRDRRLVDAVIKKHRAKRQK